jgi:catechol 2,3-dioxygenase-like lactoylglutathione lyase family enzyme
MRVSIAFLMGLLLGAVISTSSAQGTKLAGMDGLNHVGINVQDFDAAKAFFIEKMGFREAFTLRDDKGQPTLAYIQVSPNTFIELQPAGTGRPPGISHLGLQVQDIKATIAELKQRGVTAGDARVSAANSMIANVTGPEGLRIELSELGPESLQRKAIDSWK